MARNNETITSASISSNSYSGLLTPRDYISLAHAAAWPLLWMLIVLAFRKQIATLIYLVITYLQKRAVAELPGEFSRKVMDTEILDPCKGDELYCPRPLLERQICSVLAAHRSLVIYGPPRQGKTTVLNRCLEQYVAIQIDCQPDLKRSQIYRMILSSIGYSVALSTKRRGKANATIKFDLLGSQATLGADGEVERVAQAISVDLQNANEIAYLVSRIGQAPIIVINNLHLLNPKTAKRFLFDLVCFTERSRIRFVVTGAWTTEDYLEAIEPALVGKLSYVYVPFWSEKELTAFYSAYTNTAGTRLIPAIEEVMTLAAGDVSLFQALLDCAPTLAAASGSSESAMLIRFGRGLVSHLRGLFKERDAYVTYYSLNIGLTFQHNSQFNPSMNQSEGEEGWTDVDVKSGLRFSDSRHVRIDLDGNPQFFECYEAALELHQVNIVHFIVRQLHTAILNGETVVHLEDVCGGFLASLDPPPIEIDSARLRLMFRHVLEAQRSAAILPPLFASAEDGSGLMADDRRFHLYLQQISSDDLQDLLEDAMPYKLPRPRRRSAFTAVMDREQAESYVANAVSQAESVRRVSNSGTPNIKMQKTGAKE
jgi:hypothetical protein